MIFFWFLGVLRLSSDPIFILHYATPYTNLHTKFQKNPSMFVESRANTNVHHFHAKTASWWPFWISNFSQTSSIWHVLILSNMLTQYGNNRTYAVATMVTKRQMCHFTLKNEPKTTSWWLFWISNFSWNSSTWHVLILNIHT